MPSKTNRIGGKAPAKRLRNSRKTPTKRPNAGKTLEQRLVRGAFAVSRQIPLPPNQVRWSDLNARLAGWPMEIAQPAKPKNKTAAVPCKLTSALKQPLARAPLRQGSDRPCSSTTATPVQPQRSSCRFRPRLRHKVRRQNRESQDLQNNTE